ncbi:hypothetical protein GUJ93_ZPchr0010g11288 [Zizania palustris]|uniref:Uncharacterized protein n=1 Tax=Zizania palustris TaxID=103762 RepID=A0A8J6BMM1_ZIZPA|nr:hypothetical protein GUJ93_ZPchr0010g11288 [Zizania palustris]
MPDDLSLCPGVGVGVAVSVGTGFDEIGSEDDLFSVFMDIEKISSGFAAAASGGSDRDRVTESSSPPCPKHRHNSSVDGSGLFAAARKDGTTPLAEVMEAKKDMSPEQLAAIDPKRAKRCCLSDLPPIHPHGSLPSQGLNLIADAVMLDCKGYLRTPCHGD